MFRCDHHHQGAYCELAKVTVLKQLVKIAPTCFGVITIIR